MLIPISWLKKYTPVTLKLPELMWKMTEIGITTESYKKVNGDIVLDSEVTPNRPDWLSILGIAREVAVLHNTHAKLPKFLDIPRPTGNLPISIKIEKGLSGRYVGIAIEEINVKNSPKWMQERLKLVGLRPINNLVDITNYVMLELGVPIHVFDYDKFLSHKLSMKLSKGGEKFTSVDGLSYTLGENCVIIEDVDRVIDLCGIKGGSNTGITSSTTNIFIHVPIYDPVLIRKTSQKLKLSSDASYIYERGADAGNALNSLKRAVEFTLKLASGKVASDVIDSKNQSKYEPKKLKVSISRINHLLGIVIDDNKIMKYFKQLNLSPKLADGVVTCQIPSYRNDLNIEEDLIEEVARVYGYNNFPKTLPMGTVATDKVPYYYDRSFEVFLKNLMMAEGFCETNTLALTSEETIMRSQLNLDNHIRIANPVSLEYEYMRTSLIPRLLEAVKMNSDEEDLKLFEYNKVYFGPLDKSHEPHMLSAIIKGEKYARIKGVVDVLIEKLNIKSFILKPTAAKKGLWHPKRSGVVEINKDILGTVGELSPLVLQKFDIKEKLFAFELDVDTLAKHSKLSTFHKLLKYPAQIEDISLVIPKGVGIGNLISSIKSLSSLINNVELVNTYKDSYTFRVWYQSPRKTMNDKEVEKIRIKLLKEVKKKYGVTIGD